ncbi:MAG: hypothetical protein ABI679_04320 [Gemmatimonadota bacterium]
MRSLTRTCRGVALVSLVCLGVTPLLAQDVLLDRPVRAGALTVFPSASDTTQFFYVVDKARLATDSSGTPQFSFIRYASTVATAAEETERAEAEGGGIVHAVVSLSVTEDQLREARQELQRARPGARLVGPIVYKSGRFGLISSFKDPAGNLVTQVVGLGVAPVLDGGRAAVSIQLTKQGAKILWESFATAAPDVSFSFEMDMAGYRSPKRARVEANWDRVYESQAFGVGLASTYLSAEIRGAFDDLRRTGAIKITQIGEDAQMDQLVTTAYTKLQEVMFEPVNGTGTPDLTAMSGAAGGQPSLLDRATSQLKESRAEADRERERLRTEERADAARTGTTDTARATGTAHGGPAAPRDSTFVPPTEPSTRDAGHLTNDQAKAKESAASRPSQQVSTPSFAIVASYQMKRSRQSGTFTFDFNKYTPDVVTLRFDENIGDLSRLRDNPKHFRQINLEDPLYRQREVTAILDGLNAEDFGKYVNFVAVTVRKQHPNGQVTLREGRMDRVNFSRVGNAIRLEPYGWNGETVATRDRWFDYEYQTVWSFFGGRDTTITWQPTRANAVTLSPPYHRAVVTLDGDSAQVASAGVRLVTVKIFYQLGGAERQEVSTINPRKGPLASRMEFLLPKDSNTYDYEITWQLAGNVTRTTGRRTSSATTLLVDDVPPS